uniref:Uncharacterized protein n=1 Tax=Lotus japonicus TaxID=34305 RepID=I3SVK5_LOTJA|nr:unknown [Lotus japonicus]
MLVLSLSYVGNFSMAAHLRASSSSLTLEVLLEYLPLANTSSILQLVLLKLLLMLLLKSPSIFISLYFEVR